MMCDPREVFDVSNWMNGVAIIEMGKTGEKRKVGKWTSVCIC